jgi:hypothetical protein
MTLPRMEAVLKRWEQIPPLSVSLAGIAATLGVPRPSGGSKQARGKNRQSLFDDLRAAGVKPGKKPEWLTTTPSK